MEVTFEIPELLIMAGVLGVIILELLLATVCVVLLQIAMNRMTSNILAVKVCLKQWKRFMLGDYDMGKFAVEFRALAKKKGKWWTITK